MGAMADADAASPIFLPDLTEAARSSWATATSSSAFCWVCARRARALESSAREANESPVRAHHPSRSARHVSRRVTALLSVEKKERCCYHSCRGTKSLLHHAHHAYTTAVPCLLCAHPTLLVLFFAPLSRLLSSPGAEPHSPAFVNV